MFTLHIPAVIIINRTIPNINTNSQIYYKESKEEFEIFLCGSSVNQYIDCYVLFFFKRNSSCHRLLPTFGNHIKIIERFIHFCRLGTRIVPVEQVFCVTPQKLPLTASYEQPQDEVVQSERSEVFRFIVNELQEVAELLPNERSNKMGNYYGRITTPVANFLLAKLALNAEIYCDDNWTDGVPRNGKEIFFTVDGEKLNAWQTCIKYCNKLAEVGYRLEDDYSYNFSVHNENSNENIFTIPLDKNLYAAQFWYLFRSRHYNHGGALGGSSENGTSANISTVLANGYGTDDVDARFEKNFYAGIVEVDGKPVMMDNGQQLEYFPLELKLNLTGSSYVKTAGARMAKYEVDRTSHSDGRQPDNDIVLFRYADALLMKSEAKVRNGEDGSLELNEVRGRVGMPYREATLENILKERLLELVWEGWRRQDMVRFGVYHKSYDQRVQLADEKNGYTTVFPIPQKSIDLNPKLKQNVGYK